VNESKVYVQQTVESHELSPEVDHTFETSVEESGDEDGPVVVRRSAGFRSSSPSSSHPEGPPKSSGPDGYDAFENTNNKKKRKIPTPGNLGHSALSPEFANMGLTSSTPAPPPPEGPTGTYYGSGNPASPLAGISGSGRGRLSRSTVRTSNSRGPLSANAQNGWMTARTPRRDGLMSSPGPTGAFQIISCPLWVILIMPSR
jgi:hypothetical protein